MVCYANVKLKLLINSLFYKYTCFDIAKQNNYCLSNALL